VASRLYRTTRPLYLQVTGVLDRLGVAAVGSPTTAILIALYVTGLVLLDARPTQTRVARVLPGRCHDALNRLLRATPWSTRALLGLLIGWVTRSGMAGYLCLDEGVVEKAFAKRLPWAGWTYSFATKRKVYGMHVVVVWWCSTDGDWRIPVAFGLWRPKQTCATHRYQTKLQLAAGMLTELAATRLPFAYLVMDTHDTAGWFTRLASRLGLTWVGTLPPKTTVIWRGRRQPVAELAGRLRLGWRAAWAARRRDRGPCSQLRDAPVGRDQQPSRQPGAAGHQRPGCRPDPGGVPPVQPLERGDGVPRHQAGRRAGRLPVLDRPGHGRSRRLGAAHLRGPATAAP
jgi:DDE superfamily endonuclease